MFGFCVCVPQVSQQTLDIYFTLHKLKQLVCKLRAASQMTRGTQDTYIYIYIVCEVYKYRRAGGAS